MLNFVNFNNQDDLREVLWIYYPNILKSIDREEFYQIEYPKCSSFYEIKHEGEVVGFMSFEYGGLFSEDHILNEFYILPEFRGLNIGFNSLKELLLKPNFEFLLRKPNRALINLLLKNGLAMKLHNNLVSSYVKFNVNASEKYTNKKIKGIYKNSDINFKADLYDLDTYCCCCFDYNMFCSKNDEIPVMILPREGDIKKYKCMKKLKRISRAYFSKKFNLYEMDIGAIRDFESEVSDKLLDYIGLDELIGTPGVLSDSFVEKLKEHDLSLDDGLEIQKHIYNALEDEDISYESVNFRLNYLLSNFDSIDKEFDNSHGSCSFCGSNLRLQWKVCENCGEIIDPSDILSSMDDMHMSDFEISEDQKPLLAEFIKKFSDTMAKVSDAGGFRSFKLELSPDELSHPCSDEVKQFYTDNLLEYDFFEFADYSFYHDDEDDLDTLALNFLNDSLNKYIGDDDKLFAEYKRFTFQLTYFYMNRDLLKKSAVYVIQYIILDANKSSGKPNLIEGCPDVYDFSYAIESIYDKGFDEDVCQCVDEAFDTFKFPQFINHEEMLRDLIPKFFKGEI